MNQSAISTLLSNSAFSTLAHVIDVNRDPPASWPGERIASTSKRVGGLGPERRKRILALSLARAQGPRTPSTTRPRRVAVSMDGAEEEDLRRLAVCRLAPSPAKVGDKVAIFTSSSEGPPEPGAWGAVTSIVAGARGRYAVVRCKRTIRGAYPLSYAESDVLVPLSCAFDLRKAECRREYVLHSLNRSLGLPALLSPKLGDIDAPEICLNVAKHLVGYCQSLMIFSGYRAKTFESVFCRHFSRRKAYWYNVGKLPSSRIDAAVMFPAPGAVVFAGGVDDHPSVGTPLKTVASYDALTAEWVNLPEMGIRRHGCCGAALGGRLFVFGGCYAELPFNPAMAEGDVDVPFYECLDLSRAQEEGGEAAAAWEPGSKVSVDFDMSDRLFAACGVVKGRIVLAGGEIPRAYTSVRNRYTFDYHMHTVYEVVFACEAFDPETRVFEPIPGMEFARVGAAHCVWKGRLLVAGGQDEHGMTLGSSEVYDGESWIRLPDLNQARFHASLCVWNGVPTIIGGSFKDNGGAMFTPGKTPGVHFTDKVEQFSEEENRWVLCKNLRMPVAFHACVATALNRTD